MQKNKDLSNFKDKYLKLKKMQNKLPMLQLSASFVGLFFIYLLNQKVVVFCLLFVLKKITTHNHWHSTSDCVYKDTQATKNFELLYTD